MPGRPASLRTLLRGATVVDHDRGERRTESWDESIKHISTGHADGSRRRDETRGRQSSRTRALAILLAVEDGRPSRFHRHAYAQLRPSAYVCTRLSRLGSHPRPMRLKRGAARDREANGTSTSRGEDEAGGRMNGRDHEESDTRHGDAVSSAAVRVDAEAGGRAQSRERSTSRERARPARSARAGIEDEEKEAGPRTGSKKPRQRSCGCRRSKVVREPVSQRNRYRPDACCRGCAPRPWWARVLGCFCLEACCACCGCCCPGCCLFYRDPRAFSRSTRGFRLVATTPGDPSRAALELFDAICDLPESARVDLASATYDMAELAANTERLVLTRQVFLRHGTLDWGGERPPADIDRRWRAGVEVSTKDAHLDASLASVPWDCHTVVLEGLTLKSAGGFRAVLLAVDRSANVVLRRCRFVGSDYDGVRITGGSQVTMVECEVSDCGNAGVFVEDRSRLVMRDCLVSGNRCGIVASGAGTVVSVQGRSARIDGNRVSGAVAGNQAQVFIRGGSVSHNGRGREGENRRTTEAHTQAGGLLAEAGGTVVVGRYGGEVHALAGGAHRRGEHRDGYVRRRRRDVAPVLQDNVVGVLNAGGTVVMSDSGVVISSPRMADAMVEIWVEGNTQSKWEFGRDVRLSRSDVTAWVISGQGPGGGGSGQGGGQGGPANAPAEDDQGYDSDDLDPAKHPPRQTRLSAGPTKRAAQFGPVYA